MQRRNFTRMARLGLVAAAVLGLCGCGGQVGGAGADSDASKPAHLFGLNNASAPPGPQARHIFCPEIMVLEGTAAARVHAGSPPTNMNLRYQYSLGDAVRECSLEGDQIVIKVGVAGNVLLGPAGSPDSFNVPVRVAVVRESDNQPLVSKLYRAAATIPAGQTQTDFSVVSEPLRVPFIHDHAEDDYSIKVGIDEGAGVEKPAGKRNKP